MSRSESERVCCCSPGPAAACYLKKIKNKKNKNEIMPFAAIWMNLETVILSEVNQKEKEKYHDIPFMWNLKRNELTKQK